MQNFTSSTPGSEKIKLWVKLYSDDLFSWALYKTSGKETAEDLVQETFLAAVLAIDKFEEKSDPKTWLFSILNHKISDYFRNKYKNPSVIEERQNENNANVLKDSMFQEDGHWKNGEFDADWSNEPLNFSDDLEFLKTLDGCLGKLPETWHSCVQLKYISEKKGDVICQELGISATNFWQILHRAKLQLKKCLDINWFKKY